MIKGLELLDRIDAKKVILNEILKKFETLRTLEKVEAAEMYEIICETGRIEIFKEKYMDKIKGILQEMREEVTKEIIELEKQYFSMLE